MSNTSISSYSSNQAAVAEYSSLTNPVQIAADLGGDAAAQLAAMVFVFSRERSRQSAEQRDQIETQIANYQADQVEKLHQQADQAFEATVWNAAGQFVSTAGQAVGGSDGAVIGAGVQTGFSLIAADVKLDADTSAADATHAGNVAASHERRLQSVNSNSEDAKSLKEAAFDFLKAVEESKAEGDKALVSVRV